MEVRIIIAEELKVLVAEGTSIENLMLIRSALNSIQDGYEAHKFPAPEWVKTKSAEVNSEIELKLRAQLMRDIRREESLQESYKSKVERRKESESRVAEMKETLKNLGG